VPGFRAQESGCPQLNSPQLNEYRQVSRGKLSLSSSKPRLNISNRLVEQDKNLTGRAGIGDQGKRAGVRGQGAWLVL